MATTANTRSRRGSITGRRSSIIDLNENKQMKQEIPVKVLVVNGKCSEIFKSTLEECVEDCILEFPGRNSIYVPKTGPAIQISNGNRQFSNLSSRDSNPNIHQSGRSNRRRSSVTQFTIPQIGGIRSSQTNNISLSTAPLTATSTSRMRHQLAQQKYSLVENITEEATDCQTTIQDPTIIEPDTEHQHIQQEETVSHASNFDTIIQSFSPFHQKLPSARVHSSYRSRQKDFRLSDLVMHGPEYYAHVFNLPRISRYSTQTTSRQRSSAHSQRNKTEDKYSELDRIKKDLFHRYLWTQKPQVSCRIRPITTYTRSTTFVL
jgi:hypothetical protein